MKRVLKFVEKLEKAKHTLLFLFLNLYLLYLLPQLCTKSQELGLTGLNGFLAVMVAVIFVNAVFLAVHIFCWGYFVACEVTPKAIAQKYIVWIVPKFFALAKQIFNQICSFIIIISRLEDRYTSYLPQRSSPLANLPYELYPLSCALLN